MSVCSGAEHQGPRREGVCLSQHSVTAFCHTHLLPPHLQGHAHHVCTHTHMFTHMQYVYTYVCIDTYMYVHTHAQSPGYFETPYAVTKHRDLNILQVSFHFGLQFRGVRVHCGAAVADEAAGTGS